MPRVGGFKQALAMLGQLDSEASEKLLSLMSESDPEMAAQLRKELITIEDLQYISPKMLAELFREIDLGDVAMSLRISSSELRDFILANVSSGMGKEIKEVLVGPAQQKTKVNEALDRVMRIVRKKVSNKEIIIDKKNEEVV